MTTLLYGDTPGIDVEPGNRVDSASAELFAAPPPMRLMYPPTSPWVRREPARLRGMMLGVAAAAVVVSGLATFGVALVWSHALPRLASAGLMVTGGYLVAAGVAFVASARREAA